MFEIELFFDRTTSWTWFLEIGLSWDWNCVLMLNGIASNRSVFNRTELCTYAKLIFLKVQFDVIWPEKGWYAVKQNNQPTNLIRIDRCCQIPIYGQNRSIGKLVVLESDAWSFITVQTNHCFKIELLMLDKNTWNHITEELAILHCYKKL